MMPVHNLTTGAGTVPVTTVTAHSLD